MKDLSASEWFAGSGVHALSAPSRYHSPSSWLSIWASVLSTTPSPFRSPPAPPYHSCSWAGTPNRNPVGSSDTLILIGATVSLISTEAPSGWVGEGRGRVGRGGDRPRAPEHMQGLGGRLPQRGGLAFVGTSGSEQGERERNQNTATRHAILQVHGNPTKPRHSSRNVAATRRQTDSLDSRGSS